MADWKVCLMYSRRREPQPVWMTLDQLEEAAELSGCAVSMKDGGVRYPGKGYRVLQFTTESARPVKNSRLDRFIINDHKYVNLRVRCNRFLAREQLIMFIATLLNRVKIPQGWKVYHGYIEDTKKQYI